MMYPIVREFIKHPKFKQLFTRRTYRELKLEIIPRSRELYSAFGGKFNKSDLIWEFPSGACIFFGHIEHEDDVHKYDSMEINLFTPDEVQSLTEYMYLYIAFTRVRTSHKDLPAIIRAAAMPGDTGHCVSFGEVLTPNGWVDIKDFKVGDAIYEVSDSRNLIESKVEQIHVHNYNGKLWHAKTDNLEITCTPEHSISRLVGKLGRDGLKCTNTRAIDLPSQCNVLRTTNYINDLEHDSFKLEKNDVKYNKLEQPYEISFDLYVEFMGWFLSEGFTVTNLNCFGIAQVKEINKLLIKQLLENIGFQFNYNSDSFMIYSKDWYNYLSQFGKSRQKFIPREILNSGHKYLLRILYSLMAGDGHWINSKQGVYYTISKQLADDFAEITVKLEYRTNIKIRNRINREGPSYEIYFIARDFTEILTGQHINSCKTQVAKKSNVDYIDYDGPVYDIGVPLHHRFVVRQNGSVWISGNSWVKHRFIDPAQKGSKIVIGKGGNKRIFIFSTLSDNPKIDPDYAAALEVLPEAEKRAKKYGDWNAYEGQVFEEFREKHYPNEPENALHVILNFEIPDWWPKVLVIDWGYSAMTWAGYGAISPTKRAFIYREQHWKKTKIEEWASYIKEILDKEEIGIIKVCKSAGQDRGQEHTIQQQIEQALGRSVKLTNNSAGSRIAGKMLLHEYLRWQTKYVPLKEKEIYNEEMALWLLRNKTELAYKNYLARFQENVSETNIPKLQIFDTCPVLIEAIKGCVYDKTNPEDVAQFDGDDPYDGIRYLVDEIDKFFEESEFEFKKIEQRQELISEFEQTQDWNRLFRRATAIEHQSITQPVQRYSHRH